MGLVTFFGLVIVAISLTLYWIRRKFSYFDDHRFLHDKPTIPYGNLKGVGTTIHLVYKLNEYYERFKKKAPAYGLYFFVNPTIVITDLEVVKDVLVRNFDAFHNRGIYSNIEDDPLSGHLFALEDTEWKNMRAKLTPTFTSGKMKMVFGTITDIADTLVAHIKDDPTTEVIEMKDMLAKFTTDVIGNIAFGIEMNSIKDDESVFRKMGRKIFKQDSNFLLKILFLASFRNFGRKMHFRFFESDVADFFMQTIRETVSYRETNNIQRNDVMDLLLKMKCNDDSDGEKLTFNELAAQCFLFFIAGKLKVFSMNNN